MSNAVREARRMARGTAPRVALVAVAAASLVACGAQPAAGRSAAVSREVSFAMRHGVVMVPVRVGPVEFRNKRVVWLVDSLMAGFGGDGVIGNSLVGPWVVELDYDRKVMTQHEPGFKPDSTWAVLPMAMHKANTPWVKARVSVSGEEPQELDGYIDLADDDELVLLMRDGAKFKVPDDLEPVYMGRGLSGDVYGSRGRVALVELDTYRLGDLAAGMS